MDARLPDGSRVHVVLPPLSRKGMCMTIRKFAKIMFNAEHLVKLNSWTPQAMEYLKICVLAEKNLLVAGGTSSGKTCLLNVLSGFIPAHQRIVVIEDSAELELQQDHVVSLESRPADRWGRGQVGIGDLFQSALRLRPDRIIIGEVRGPEALDMLQAMNTGHEGSMTTVHANNPRDALRRIENMVSMAGLNFPVHVIRQQTASALNMVVHLGRMTGGRRKIVHIGEITGMEGDAICLQDIFRFKQTGVDTDGHAKGYFEACGVRPQLLERLTSEGIEMPPDLFHRRALGGQKP
jgi:pilus assembly protein CpaF